MATGLPVASKTTPKGERVRFSPEAPNKIKSRSGMVCFLFFIKQVSSKKNDVEYLLTRLVDCESFPNLDTPMVRAKFDLLRRQLLARLGDFKNAFDMKLPQDPAHECT